MSRPRPRGEVGGSSWRGGCLGPDPGGRLGGLAGGCPGPHLGVPGPGLGCVSQHALRQTPISSRRLLLRAVGILMKCILVYR